MIIKFKRGKKSDGLPRGKLGEPLFQYDTGELYIGMGYNKDPVRVNGISIYKQTEQPQEQSENDIWIDTSQDVPLFYVYSQTDGWIQLNQQQQVGNLSDLLTKNKDNLVNQINELYSRTVGIISNFHYEILNDGNTIRLNWKNPNSPEFVSRELFMSNVIDLISYNRDDCQNDQNVSLITQGSGTGIDNFDSIDIDVQVGNTYFFKIFQKFDYNGTIIYSDGLYLKVVQEDVNPPDNVSDLKQRQLPNLVDLTWVNPTNQDFQGIRIIRREDRFPQSPDESSLDNSILVVDLNSTTTFYRDTLVEPEKTYYYQLFPFDTNGNYNTNEQNRVVQKPSIYSIDDVFNLKQVSQNEGKEVLITWTNPDDRQNEEKYFHQRELYVSTKDISTFTRTQCFDDPEIELLDNTVGTGQGNDDSYLYDSSQYNVGDRLFFKIFTVYEYQGLYFYSQGLPISVVLIDNTPPDQSNISNVEVYEEEIRFNITDQNNQDWQGQYIVKKYGTDIPVDEKDYDYRWTYNIKNQYISNKFVDDNVQIGQTYTYKVFQFDEYGNVNKIGNTITVTVQRDVKQVSNLKQSTSQENTVILTWMNPLEQDYQNWQGTVIVRKQGSEPTSVNDGMLLFETQDRTVSKYVDTQIIPGVTYYYRQFTYELNGNNERVYNEQNKRVVSQTPFQIPPSDISNVKIYVDKYNTNSVYLSWNDPPDSDWYLTKVIRNEGTPPEDVTGGVVILNSLEFNKYSNILMKDFNLSNDVDYFYGIFPQDLNYNYNYNYKTKQINFPSVIEFPDINSPTPSTTDDGTTLILNWNEPTPPENYTNSGYFVFLSEVDLSNYSFIDCYNNSFGNILWSSYLNTNSCSKSNLEVNKKYYIKVFTVYLNNTTGINYLSQGLSFSYTMVDTEPPDTVLNFQVTQGDREQYISWNDPDDKDWYGTIIIRKQNSEPVDENDGHVVIDTNEKNRYTTSNILIDSELTNGVIYYYKQITYDIYGNYNRSLPQVSITPYVTQKIPEPVNEVTVLGKQQGKSVEIKTQDDQQFFGYVDVLKQDYTEQVEDKTKTIQQFDLQDQDRINEGKEFIDIIEDSIKFSGNKIIYQNKQLNDVFITPKIEIDKIKINKINLSGVLKINNYYVDQTNEIKTDYTNLVRFDDVIFINQEDWVNNHYLTDTIRSLPDGGSYLIVLGEGTFLDIDGTFKSDLSDRLMNKNITILGTGYNTKLGINSSTYNGHWTLFPQQNHWFRFINIHFLNYGYTPITSKKSNPINTFIYYYNCIFNTPNVGDWAQNQANSIVIYKNVFYRVIYYWSQYVKRVEIYNSIEYQGYSGYSVKQNTVVYQYNFDSNTTTEEEFKNQIQSYTQNNQGPYQGYFPMDQKKIVGNYQIISFNDEIYIYDDQTQSFISSGIFKNQITQSNFDQYKIDLIDTQINNKLIEFLNSHPNGYFELITLKNNSEINISFSSREDIFSLQIDSEPILLNNIENIDMLNLDQEVQQNPVNISISGTTESNNQIYILTDYNIHTTLDNITFRVYTFNKSDYFNGTISIDIPYYNDTNKILFQDSITDDVKYFDINTNSLIDLNKTINELTQSDFNTYGILLNDLNNNISNLSTEIRFLIFDQDINLINVIVKNPYITDRVLYLPKVSNLSNITFDPNNVYLISFDDGNTWKYYDILSNQFVETSLNLIDTYGNTQDEMSTQLSNYIIDYNNDKYLKFQVLKILI